MRPGGGLRRACGRGRREHSSASKLEKIIVKIDWYLGPRRSDFVRPGAF